MSFESPTDQLLVELRSNVAVVTLNRPEARNALSPALTGALRKAIDKLRRHRQVEVQAADGAGNVFFETH